MLTPSPAATEALERLVTQWRGRDDFWVFGYASLIWRPEFDAVEQRPAVVRGWHRALRMRSRVNRGTPERHGLVFALLSGGACRGLAYRLPQASLESDLRRLWAREMPTGVYQPRMLTLATPAGAVQALAFTLPRQSPACLPRLPDEQVLDILRHARGRYGTTLDYLLDTATSLEAHGIPDREVKRLVTLARRHGLAP